MTQPLNPVRASLLPTRSCQQGIHSGRPDQSTHTAGGTWWRCRCGHAWHVDAMGRMTGRRP